MPGTAMATRRFPRDRVTARRRTQGSVLSFASQGITPETVIIGDTRALARVPSFPIDSIVGAIPDRVNKICFDNVD